MAYRFNNISDYVEFANTPFNGNSFGVGTFAAFVKRSGAGFDSLVAFTDSSFNERLMFYFDSADTLRLYRGGSAGDATFHTSTTLWYLVAVTFPSGSASPRFHFHDGTSWTHITSGSTIGANLTIAGTDKLVVGRASAGLNFGGDMVCAGIKKATATDLQVETLSRTAFSAWAAFGFDWLIGFDTSLTSAGVLQDQASPGTGDQTGISGTTVVADPPGWSFATTPAAPPFVPRIIAVT